MPLKYHLIIISLIIAVVFAMQNILNKPQEQVQAEPQVIEISEFNISVVRASWGLNCRRTYSYDSNGNVSDGYKATGGNDSALREDNVLSAVSGICNGKDKCDIPITTAALGDDPMPSCTSKVLQVEYRCFNYDRLWQAKGSLNTLQLDCNKLYPK